MMTLKKSVLIITPHFAPETHAAVFRAHKLAKYLPEHGWKPYVLTVDTNYVYNEDPGLLDELPAEVEIIRARYIEPTVRGLRMALGGEDRTYAALKANASGSDLTISRAAADLSGPGRPQALLGGAYAGIRRRWLASPDRYRTWRKPALRLASDLVHQHGVSLIYSTCLPYTPHQMAMELTSLGSKWVADFRDPATYGRRFGSGLAQVRAKQQDVVRETLRRADAVTATAASYGLIFHDLYGPITRQPVQFIPTGIDDDLVPDRNGEVASTTHPPYIIFVGETMPDAGSEFFEMLAGALRCAKPHRLLVVGHELLNRRRLGPVLERTGLKDVVDFRDHVPQRELYQLIDGARACVLVPGRSTYWWNLHAKLVDYVGLRKPVLAVVPDPSEARSVLTRARLGVFLDGPEPQAVRTLVDFLNGDTRLPEPNAEECDRFLASTQVRSFAALFDSLVER